MFFRFSVEIKQTGAYNILLFLVSFLFCLQPRQRRACVSVLFASVAATRWDEMRERVAARFLSLLLFCDKSRWSTTLIHGGVRWLIWYTPSSLMNHILPPPISSLSLLVVYLFFFFYSVCWYLSWRRGKEVRAFTSGTRWRLHFMAAFLLAHLLLLRLPVRMFA